MDIDSLQRAHSVALCELQQKQNAELLRIKKLVKHELSKLSLVATSQGFVNAEVVTRIESRILDRL
jgi:hypothetical protein